MAPVLRQLDRLDAGDGARRRIERDVDVVVDGARRERLRTDAGSARAARMPRTQRKRDRLRISSHRAFILSRISLSYNRRFLCRFECSSTVLVPSARRSRARSRHARAFRLSARSISIATRSVSISGDVIGFGKKLKVRVTNDAAGAIKSGKPDVVVLCTSSSLKKVMPQIETAPVEEGRHRLDHRGAVVSGRQEPRAREEDRRDGEEGEGRRARHRRQSRDSRWTRCRSRSPGSASASTAFASIGCRTPGSAACRSSRRSAPA